MHPDIFQAWGDGINAPAKHAFAIIPHVSDDLPAAAKAIYVGGEGDLTVRLIGSDEDVTFVNVSAGTILPVRVRAVRASTTAADLLGLA